MSAFIAGLFCSLVLAALILLWIAYCMFYREKHVDKASRFHYNIAAAEARHAKVEEVMEVKEEKPLKPSVASVASVGVLVLPPLQRHKDEYIERPDYPETSTQTLNDNLLDILNTTPPIDGFDVVNGRDNTSNFDINNTDTLPMESKSQVQSEV